MPVGVAWISPSAPRQQVAELLHVAAAAVGAEARASASTSSSRALGLDVEHGHVPGAERERGVGDRRAGAARAEQHDAVGGGAGQPALERLLEAGRVGVVADQPTAVEARRC